MKKQNAFAVTFPCLVVAAAMLGQQGVAQAPSGPPPGAGPAGAPRQQQPPPTLRRYMAVNTGENDGDMLALPRLIAADVVATDNPSPKKIVDVGSFTGEFLEAFMDKFPGARGQWTEPVDSNKVNAKRRFARFGDRLDYVIGCPHRDLSDGCVPKDVDVLITSWVTRHQELPGIRKVYKDAYPLLPSGGWFAILDQVTVPDHWEKQFQVARLNFMAAQEGPPEYQKAPIPTLDEQLAALHDAGFTDVQVVWKEFTTVLIMARKN